MKKREYSSEIELPAEVRERSYYRIKKNDGSVVTKSSGELTESERSAVAEKELSEAIWGKKDRSGEEEYAIAGGKTDLRRTGDNAYVTIDDISGEVVVHAPKEVLENEAFQKSFDVESLKNASRSYRLNKDYKFPYKELKEDGTTEEKEITIPEYIDKLSASLKNYTRNYFRGVDTRDDYIKKYGDKAANLSVEDAIRSIDINGGVVSVPEFLRNSVYFDEIKDAITEDGLLSVEEFKKIYNRDKMSKEDVVGLTAMLKGRLAGSDWTSEQTYKDEDGKEIYNKNNSTEMAKTLALLNYIEQNDPDADWVTSAGDAIVTGFENAGYQFSRVFLNIANVVEGVVTLGNGHFFQNTIKEDDETIDTFNEEQALINDSTKLVATLSSIGGLVLGTIASAWLGGVVATEATGAIMTSAGDAIQKLRAINALVEAGGSSAVLTAEAVATVTSVNGALKAVAGAVCFINALPGAEKALMAKNTAKAFLAEHKLAGTMTGFLMDTVHDAFLYDSVSLREALESSDQDTRNYWMGQLVDNGKWWAGVEGGKLLLKGAGKTSLGKLLNAAMSTKVNKLLAKGGDLRKSIRNAWANGDYEEKIRQKLQKAIDSNQNRKANRLKNKIELLEQYDILREARRELGNVKIEHDGIKLTSASEKKYLEAAIGVKAVENSIDIYNRSVEFKRQEMIGASWDPATKSWRYVNPTLAGANNTATDGYLALAKRASELGMKPADGGGWLPQNIIDYMQLRVERARYKAIAGSKTVNAAKAQKAYEDADKMLRHVRRRLPVDVKKMADDLSARYFGFYTELTEYGCAKRLLDKERIDGYYNETWNKAGGWQPVVARYDKGNKRIVDTEGKIDAVIEQEMRGVTYTVAPHYVDPELVRQSRINRMAKAEINVEMLDSYKAVPGASISEFVTGEQTAFVRKAELARETLTQELKRAKIGLGDNAFDVVAVKGRNTAKLGKKLTAAESDSVVSAMSNRDIGDFLTRKGLLGGVDGDSWTGNIKTDEDLQEFFGNFLNKKAQNYFKSKMAEFSDDGAVTLDNFKNVMNAYGDDFENGLRRAYLSGDSDFAKSDMAKAAKKWLGKNSASFQGMYVYEAKGEFAHLKTIKNGDELADSLAEGIEKSVADYCGILLESPAVKKSIEAYTEAGSVASDVVAENYLLRNLREDPDAMARVRDMVMKDISIDELDKKAVAEQIYNMFRGYLDTRIDETNLTIKSLSGKPIDEEEVFEEVKRINDDIKFAKNEVDLSGGDTGMIMYIDGNGRQAFAKVDPAFASLYNRRYQVSQGEASLLAKANAAMSTVFRRGATGMNIASWGNQLFRDYGSTVMMGGAWSTIKNSADDMKNVFGENVVNQLKAFDPDGYEIKQLTALAKETGQSLDAAAISRELMIGSTRAPSSTERDLYKKLWSSMKKDSDIKLENMENKLKETLKRFDPENLVNGKRENYLRNRVYANNLSDALKRGYSLKQSRIFAEFAMNNATTNFGRQIYHMQAIAESTPYFKAAINSTSSFWRMWSLDPVGISGRIMGGLILPAMALVGYSLSNEENRKVYENIPEYQKDESLVFVVDGQTISVPFPQELSSVVAPFRQFVEYLYGADKYTFSELMMNDLLGFSPVDLSGFSTVDMNRMSGDPTFADIVGRGFSRVFAQIAPVPLKTAYMLATGIDPYTGKHLNSPSYWYWDDESGALELMDYSQNALANILGKNNLLGRDTAVWERVISGLFGTAGADVLDDILVAFTESDKGFMENAMENIADAATSPITVPQYNLTDSLWKQAVKELTAEKNAILNNDKVQTLNKELAMEKDPEKRKQLLAERDAYADDYTRKVADTVKRLSSEYKGTFDKGKLAAVIQLLNFNSDAVWQAGSQASSNEATDMFYSGRDAAIQMMSQMGIDGTEDMSVFGYLALDKNGNPVVKYNQPVTVMDLANNISNQSDYHLANIKAIVSANKLYDKHQAVQEQINDIYSKGKLSDGDYAAIDAIKVNWNAEVMKTLAEYADKYSAEAAINNKAVRDYLYTYIEVPGDWSVNGKGRHPSLGSRGNTKSAYYDSWIKTMFGVNDPYKGQY